MLSSSSITSTLADAISFVVRAEKANAPLAPLTSDGLNTTCTKVQSLHTSAEARKAAEKEWGARRGGPVRRTRLR